jgi:hypothetical protein
LSWTYTFLRGMELMILSPHLTDPKFIHETFDIKYGTAQSAFIWMGIVTPYGTWKI